MISRQEIQTNITLGALQTLESRGFIEALSESRDFFRVTGQGYEAADRLKDFCRWDVESVLLRASHFNAPPDQYKLACKGVVALPAKFDVDTAADGTDMRSLKDQRAVVIEGVNLPPSLDWSPNQIEFTEKNTGKTITLVVRGMQPHAGGSLKLPFDR